MSPLIREALSNDALQQRFCPGGVAHAERLAIVVPKIKLCNVAVQMVVAAVLVHALHAALEHREEAFDGVGVDRAVIR